MTLKGSKKILAQYGLTLAQKVKNRARLEPEAQDWLKLAQDWLNFEPAFVNLEPVLSHIKFRGKRL